MTVFVDSWLVEHWVNDERTVQLLLRYRDKLRPVASLWQIYEIINDGDARRRERKMDLLEALRPLWIKDLLLLQKEEARFHYMQQIGMAVTKESPFSETLSEAFLADGIRPDWTTDTVRGAVFSLQMQPQPILNLRATMQTWARQEKALLVSPKRHQISQEDIFRESIRRYPPLTSSNGLVLPQRSLGFADFAATWDFRTSRVFALHYHHRIMALDMPRPIEASELVDQVQVLPALLYCNVVTSDKRMKELARRLRPKLPFSLAAVYHHGERVQFSKQLESCVAV